MYTLTDNEAKLPEAVLYLKRMPSKVGQCLGYCRGALATIGLRLPPPQVPHSTALINYHLLAADPAAYGWIRVNQPDAHQILLSYFGNCGTETTDDGARIVCGHVALKLGNTLYSSDDYTWGPYWEQRLLGFFIPA